MSTMALSDELLADAKRLSEVRDRVQHLVDELGATAGFLVDEEGTPFATVGHVEFELPHPLTNLSGGDAVLQALVGASTAPGKPTRDVDSRYLVERVGDRALLALLLPSEVSSGRARSLRRRLRQSANAIARLF